MTIQDIYNILDACAPFSLQESYDKSGLLVGDPLKEVHRILLTLDITTPVVEEAAERHADLILSHHPVIWDPLKSVTDDGPGSKALRMIEHHVAAICMHTNLDIAVGGVNDVLMSILGGEVEAPLDQSGCGRIGHLREPMPLDSFLAICKTKLQANGLRYYDAGHPVYKLAVMGGSGADAIEDAFLAGCDTYVTSDIKYHQFQRAQELGLNLIDADHFCTENPVIAVLADHLQQKFPSVDFSISISHQQLISFL